MEKCDRTEGYELRVVNWGNLARPVHQVPLSILETGMLLSSGCRKAPLTGGSYDLLQRKVRESFLYLTFLKFL